MSRPIKHGKYTKKYRNYCKKCHKRISPFSVHCSKHKVIAIGWKHKKSTIEYLRNEKIKYYKTHKHPSIGRIISIKERKMMSQRQREFLKTHPNHLRKLSNIRKNLFKSLSKKEIHKRFYSYTIVKHHKDLNRNNNQNKNIWKLHKNLHRKLHLRAYDYLVKLGLIDNYIRWFKNKYKKEFLKLKIGETNASNK